MIDFLFRNWPWIVFLTVMLTMHSRSHGRGMHGHSRHDHHESRHENHRGTVSHDEDKAAGNAAKTEVPRANIDHIDHDPGPIVGQRRPKSIAPHPAAPTAGSCAEFHRRRSERNDSVVSSTPRRRVR